MRRLRVFGVVGLALSCGCDCYTSRRVGSDGPGPGPFDASGDDAPDAAADAAPPGDAAPTDAAPTTDAGDVDAGPIDLGPLRLDDSDFANHPRVAMDGDGAATVVWSYRRGVATRRFEPSTGWLDAEDLGPGIDPAIDFDARGDGVCVWRDIDTFLTHARIWSPGVGWLADDVLGPGGNFVEVAIDADGNAIALFGSVDADGNERVHWSRWEPASGWSAESLLDDGSPYTRKPAIAVNDAGDFAALWTRFDAGAESLWGSRWSDGAWTAPSQIGSQDSVVGPALAVSSSGDGYAVWVAYDADSLAGVWAAREPFGDAYGDPDSLADVDGTTTVAVSAAPDGSVFAAWENGTAAIAAHANAGEGFVDVWGLDGPRGVTDLYRAIDVAADDASATVVWSQDADGVLGIWRNRGMAGLDWGDADRVDPAFEDGDSHWPDVDVAPDGTAAIVWQDADGFSGVWGVIVEP